MNSLFGVEDLSIHRNAIRILERINWKVNRGEHWVILGANGSGKTSLLKALTGYMTPTAGRIVVLGEQYGRQRLARTQKAHRGRKCKYCPTRARRG
jgi:ABC-type molybdenum transport system ATPase subunit/photorepair protein PhrA